MAVALVAVALVGELWVRAVADYLPPRNSAGAGEVAVKHDALAAFGADTGSRRVVFIGDSMVDAAADPAVFVAGAPLQGRVYNAALMGARLNTQAHWLNDVVLPLARPDLVIHGMSPTLVSTFGMDPQGLTVYDSILNTNIAAVRDPFWSRLDETVSDRVALVERRNSLRYPSTLLNATWSKLTNGKPFLAAVRPPGFWEKNLAADGHIRAFASGSAAGGVPEGLLPSLVQLVQSPADLTQLETVLDVYRRRSVPAVVVLQPAALSSMRKSGVDVDAWRRLAGQLRQRIEQAGLAVIDMTDVGYPDTLFFDTFHLNAEGSARYSTDLAQRVARLCAERAELRCAS